MHYFSDSIQGSISSPTLELSVIWIGTLGCLSFTANEFIGSGITSVEDVPLVDPVSSLMASGLVVLNFVLFYLKKIENEILNKIITYILQSSMIEPLSSLDCSDLLKVISNLETPLSELLQPFIDSKMWSIDVDVGSNDNDAEMITHSVRKIGLNKLD